MAKRSYSSVVGGEPSQPIKKTCIESIDTGSDVSDIQQEQRNVTVHGVVLQLSPTRVSKKNKTTRFFDDKISDGKWASSVVSLKPILLLSIEIATLWFIVIDLS